MKIAFLAPGTSIHTQRWLGAMTARGHDIVLFTQHPADCSLLPRGCCVRQFPHRGATGYFRNALQLRRALRQFEPDLLHAHYASGYETTAALTRFPRTLLSVWGSDVFDFPHHSPMHRWLIQHNLRSATRIASTSAAMAREVRALVPDVLAPVITPFGVDCDVFIPKHNSDPSFLTIGTVKTLTPTYGIDILLQAFALLVRDRTLTAAGYGGRLRLLIAGDGPQRPELEALAFQLGVRDATTFAGAVAHVAVPELLGSFDIFAASSRQESFGVAAVEASASGLPVVVSDAGGLPEVVLDGRTGFVVARGNAAALADALRRLILDPALRTGFGSAGRAYVREAYDWARCVDRMEAAYADVSSVADMRDNR